MQSFATAMAFVALAIVDFERHRLEGLTTWHYFQLCPDQPVERLADRQRLRERTRTPPPPAASDRAATSAAQLHVVSQYLRAGARSRELLSLYATLLDEFVAASRRHEPTSVRRSLLQAARALQHDEPDAARRVRKLIRSRGLAARRPRASRAS
jgi:hypothetical protein